MPSLGFILGFIWILFACYFGFYLGSIRVLVGFYLVSSLLLVGFSFGSMFGFYVGFLGASILGSIRFFFEVRFRIGSGVIWVRFGFYLASMCVQCGICLGFMLDLCLGHIWVFN